MSANNKSTFRERIEELPGVTRTWFEWASAKLPDEVTLVVEVGFDTDPNASDFRRDVIEAIVQALEDARQEELHIEEGEVPTFVIGLRILPVDRR
jgi:hypothetical protein